MIDVRRDRRQIAIRVVGDENTGTLVTRIPYADESHGWRFNL
jgi:hypothetical protein